MKITMKQIAEIAGVHRSTVDKVIHGRPGVSDDVRQKVQKIIDEVGYKPNMIGMALKSQSKVFRLAIILLEVDAMPYLREGIEHGAEEFRDFNVEMLYHTCKFSEPEEQARLVREAVQKGCDGIILSPINAGVVRDAVNYAAEKGIPTITMNSDLTESRRICTVDQDNDKEGRIAGRLMGTFLRERGKIAIVTAAYSTENNNYGVKNRESSFLSFVEEHFPDIKIVRRIESMEDPVITFAQTMRLLEEETDLDGILITCGGMKEVGRAIKINGTRGLVVVCYSDYPEIQALMKENIVTCTIASDLPEQGKLPVQLMMNHLLLRQEPEQEQYFVKSAIMVKESI
ncbi:MAG: LacI family DNA-binding transcriptional regulator [Eubacteriales bacterium]|nr:LacI family DNA-binding transcriptional regulator [Eubacteriales bacterium]